MQFNNKLPDNISTKPDISVTVQYRPIILTNQYRTPHDSDKTCPFYGDTVIFKSN